MSALQSSTTDALKQLTATDSLLLAAKDPRMWIRSVAIIVVVSLITGLMTTFIDAVFAGNLMLIAQILAVVFVPCIIVFLLAKAAEIYLKLDVGHYVNEVMEYITGTDTNISSISTVVTNPVVAVHNYPLGVVAISYNGYPAVMIDYTICTVKQIKSDPPAGASMVAIIDKYGEESQGRYNLGDDTIYKVGDADIFDDDRTEDQKAYAVLKSKVVDAFNYQASLTPILFNSAYHVSATGALYDELILPYVKSLGLTEQQYVDKYAKK